MTTVSLPPTRRWIRPLLFGVGAVVLLLAVSWHWLATTGVKDALQSDKLRALVGQKTAAVLNAPSGYQQFVSRGDSLVCDGLLARGKPPSPLTVLEASKLEVRARWLKGLWRRALHLDYFKVGRLQAAYGAAGAKLLPPDLPLPESHLENATDAPSNFRVEIERVSVAHADLAWGSDESAAGGILGTQAECVTEGAGALRVALSGGTFRQSGWPELSLVTAAASFVRPTLHVTEARLRLPAGTEKDGEVGDVIVAGELGFTGKTPLEARLNFARCPVGPLLPARWQERLTGGQFDGQVKVDANLGEGKAPARYSGNFAAGSGRLHGLRMLNQIADITKREELSKLRLRQVRATFAWDGRKLRVSDFEVDAGNEKLLRVEGEFEIENAHIDGVFQLGAIPSLIEKIPGARERVFTRVRDGYAWTRLEVNGPLDHPHEDLRARLIKAAEAQIAGEFLGPVLGPGKEVLTLLRELVDSVD